MAKTFAPALTVTATGQYNNTTDNLTATTPTNLSFSKTLTSGTGADQVDLYFDDDRSVANGVPDDIDLAGSLSDIYGSTLTFAKVKLIFIENTSTTAGEILSVGGNATNQFINWVGDSSDIIKVGPGGCFLLFNPSAAGYAVTASTGDILQIASDSGTITYRLSIWGTSA